MSDYYDILRQQKCTTDDRAYEFVLNHLDKKDPFSFSKMNDGEMSLITKNGLTVARGLQQYSDALSGHMVSALVKPSKEVDNYYVGRPCSECYPSYQELFDQICEFPEENVKLATCCINHNYPGFITEFIPRLQSLCVGHIGSFNSGLYRLLNIHSENVYATPQNNAYEFLTRQDAAYAIEEIVDACDIILFSCGPAGRWLCRSLYPHFPDKTFFDAGSMFDPWKSTPTIHKYQWWHDNQNALAHCDICNRKA